MEKINRVIENLKNNNIDAVFVETSEEARNIVSNMLFEGCVITAGGSMSLKESGIAQILNDEKYIFKNRSKSGLTPEEQDECFKAQIGADFFFCSSNAVTENGELINVDGFSNRVSGIEFGPKKVVMIVGKNKIVKDANEGFLRVKKIAAPKNTVRLLKDTPCAKLGHCISLEKSDNPDITDGCKCADRICVSYLVTAFQRIKNRITVIIVNEDLGY